MKVECYKGRMIHKQNFCATKITTPLGIFMIDSLVPNKIRVLSFIGLQNHKEIDV